MPSLNRIIFFNNNQWIIRIIICIINRSKINNKIYLLSLREAKTYFLNKIIYLDSNLICFRTTIKTIYLIREICCKAGSQWWCNKIWWILICLNNNRWCCHMEVWWIWTTQWCTIIHIFQLKWWNMNRWKYFFSNLLILFLKIDHHLKIHLPTKTMMNI